MNFHHVQFYVDDVDRWSEWFVKTLQFAWVRRVCSPLDETVWLRQGPVKVALTGARCDRSPVALYLRQHPPGVVDLAFAVANLPATLQRLWQQGAVLRQPIQRQTVGDSSLPCAQVAGWGGLTHSLVQTETAAVADPALPASASLASAPSAVRHLNASNALSSWTVGIDHAVLNVPGGELQPAVDWYCQVFGFQPQQRFNIQTATSGLHSQVLTHPEGNVQLPINEPSSNNSQIQTFLDENRGAGVQHLALQTPDLVKAVTALCPGGLDRLSVPEQYYQQLTHRPGYVSDALDWQTIRQHHILVDWPEPQPQSLLLQTFTRPIFDQPTFFFELIERRCYQRSGRSHQAQGFGEGNFQALFEAVEREQQRTSAITQ
ncbi:MAG: 4-hydroxyphenylpyruvate dioxygenase [Cyanobacteria bacterium P01_A01_bin.105]